MTCTQCGQTVDTTIEDLCADCYNGDGELSPVYIRATWGLIIGLGLVSTFLFSLALVALVSVFLQAQP